MAQKIDLKTWQRRDIYAQFSAMEFPFYSITLCFDVTHLREVAHERHLSFYYLMVWACTKVLNAIPEFRIRLRDGDLVIIDEAKAGLSILKNDEPQYHNITIPFQNDAAAFCEAVNQRAEAAKEFSDQTVDDDEIIYYSCTPWFDFTALTYAHFVNRDDMIPRLTWGRFFQQDGRTMIHLSLGINHRTIDGIMINRFKTMLEQEIAAL